MKGQSMRASFERQLSPIVLVAGVLAAAGAAHAADPGMARELAPMPNSSHPVEVLAQAQLDRLVPLAIGASAGMPSLGFVTNEIAGPVVKGAPYTAEAVSETIQTLADGNRIVRRSLMRLARDGEGRTRQERVVDGQVRSVFINDVVAGRSYMLDPELQRVRELPGGRGRAASGADDMAWADEMRRWAQEFAARFRAEAMSDPARQVRVEVLRRADGGVSREVETVVTGSPGAAPRGLPPSPPTPPPPPTPPLPPPPMIFAPAGDGVSKPLGTRDFDGVRADGTRTTWSIAAGRIGNEKPIEIVAERWYAPDLLLVVSTRRSDPRSGETSYRLTNLKRVEPDAALFKVPAGYEPRGAQRMERK